LEVEGDHPPVLVLASPASGVPHLQKYRVKVQRALPSREEGVELPVAELPGAPLDLKLLDFEVEMAQTHLAAVQSARRIVRRSEDNGFHLLVTMFHNFGKYDTAHS